MNSILKSDIFFVVTTLCVALISLGFAVVLFYAVRILRDVKVLSQKAKEEGSRIIEDVRVLRESAEDKTARITTLLSAFLAFLPRKPRKKE